MKTPISDGYSSALETYMCSFPGPPVYPPISSLSSRSFCSQCHIGYSLNILAQKHKRFGIYFNTMIHRIQLNTQSNMNIINRYSLMCWKRFSIYKFRRICKTEGSGQSSGAMRLSNMSGGENRLFGGDVNGIY